MHIKKFKKYLIYMKMCRQEVGWGRVKGGWVGWYGGVVVVVGCREGCGSGVGGEGG